MPQQRVVVGYDKSPRHETTLPPRDHAAMDMEVAQQIKRALLPTIGGTIRTVELVDEPDSEPA
jgi:hypothetical protein